MLLATEYFSNRPEKKNVSSNNNQMCTNDELGGDIQFTHKDTSHTLITLKPNLSIFQITNEYSCSLQSDSNLYQQCF
jgi:hypothetical protein